MIASDKAMQAMIASDKTLQAMIASDKAMQAITASDKALQAMIASDKAMQAVIANNSVLQKNAKALYETVSTSDKWVNNGLKKSYSYSPVLFSSSKKAIVFVNVGGYSNSETGQVFHSNNTVAGEDNIYSVYNKTALDRNKLIVTFTNGYGKPKTAAVFNYEVWTLK